MGAISIETGLAATAVMGRGRFEPSVIGLAAASWQNLPVQIAAAIARYVGLSTVVGDRQLQSMLLRTIMRAILGGLYGK